MEGVCALLVYSERGSCVNNEARVVVKTMINARSKFLDYIELMKPELTGLSVLTALCGFYLGGDVFHPLPFLMVALGTLLLGGGAGTLNQYMERTFHAMMKRTERRPIPAGRLLPGNALIFGLFLSVSGLVVLFVGVNILTGAVGFATSALRGGYAAWQERQGHLEGGLFHCLFCFHPDVIIH